MPQFSAALREALAPRDTVVFPVLSISWPSGTAHYSDRPLGHSGLGALLPRILELPAPTFAAPAWPGALAFPETSVLLDNRDDELSAIIEGGVDPSGSTFTLAAAAPGVDQADWYTTHAGVVGSPQYEGRAVRVTLRAIDAPLRGNLPRAQILKAEASLALDSSWGTYYPLLYGIHDSDALTGTGMVPCPNYMHSGAGACRYALCLGWAKSVDRVFLNGTLQVEGGGDDYTVQHRIVGGKLITSIEFVAETPTDAVVTADATGYETVGDGSGDVILNPVDQLVHLLTNFGFGDYRFGPWLDPADSALDLVSIAVASSFSATMGFEGAMRLGGTAESEQVTDVLDRWSQSWLPFRVFWSEQGQLGIAPISHLFAGYDSPGFGRGASGALFLRGRIHEIGDSFRPSREPRVVRRVDLSYLYGAQDQKFWQSLAVQDVSQTQQVVEAFQLFHSAARLV